MKHIIYTIGADELQNFTKHHALVMSTISSCHNLKFTLLTDLRTILFRRALSPFESDFGHFESL